MTTEADLAAVTDGLSTMGVSSKTTFVEHVNVKRCNAVFMLSKKEIKATFWDAQDEVFSEDTRCLLNNFNTYVDCLKGYMTKAVLNEGTIRQTYKFSEGKEGGRIFVNGIGLQNMQHKVRNYVSGEFYFDVDLVNAYPRLLLLLAQKAAITTEKLNEYVEDRTRVLKEHNLTKRDILVCLFQDKHKSNKRHDEWFQSFVTELTLVKQGIYDFNNLGQYETNNSDNPLSSRLGFFLGVLENEIIQFAMSFVGDHCEVPMFDGFLVHKAITKGDVKAFETKVAALNKACCQQF